MDKRSYNLAVGIILLIASFLFFMMPVFFLRLDPLIPVMLALISFIIALASFFMGYSEK